jgi:hypothetical protein
MQNWVGVVVALAMVLQVSILIALFWQTKRTMQKVEKTVTDLNERAGPILTRVQIMLDDTQPKISTMVSGAGRHRKWTACLRTRRTGCAASCCTWTGF